MTKPRTAADLTRVVAEIEQRLPPRRRKPSLPAVTMEGTGKGRTKPIATVATPERRYVVKVDTHVGAGTDRSKEPQLRALTTVERLYHSGAIQWEQTATAITLRNRVLTALGGSEGVSSYGERRLSGPAWQKADRKAEAVLRGQRNTK